MAQVPIAYKKEFKALMKYQMDFPNYSSEIDPKVLVY